MRTKLLMLSAFLMVVVLCSSTALALDPMGPPKSSLQEAQVGIGIDYALSDMTIGRIPASWSSNANKTADIDEMHKVYATLGYGLSDNVEGFVRVGIGSAEVDRLGGNTDWVSDGGDWDTIWGFGVKATLVEKDKFAWGFLAQYSSAELECDQKEKNGTDKQEIELDITELQVAFGPTVQLTDKVCIYGGPFLHIIDGSYIDKQDDGDILTKTIEEEEKLGGYIGSQISLDENKTLNIEYQDTGEAWAASVGATFSF